MTSWPKYCGPVCSWCLNLRLPLSHFLSSVPLSGDLGSSKVIPREGMAKGLGSFTPGYAAPGYLHWTHPSFDTFSSVMCAYSIATGEEPTIQGVLDLCSSDQELLQLVTRVLMPEPLSGVCPEEALSVRSRHQQLFCLIEFSLLALSSAWVDSLPLPLRMPSSLTSLPLFVRN